MGGASETGAANQIDGEELVDKFLQCALCLEQYKEPKVLPCQHSFCCECLTNYITARGVRGSLPCPLCQADTKIPGNKVENFPTNFMITNLLEHVSQKVKESTSGRSKKEQQNQSQSKSILEFPVCETDTCDLCDGENVDSFCEMCSTWLCGSCTRGHQKIKATSTHHLVHVDEIKQKCQESAKEWEDRLKPLIAEREQRIALLRDADRQQDADIAEAKKKIAAAVRDFHNAINKQEERLLQQVDQFYRERRIKFQDWISEVEENLNSMKTKMSFFDIIKDDSVKITTKHQIVKSGISSLSSCNDVVGMREGNESESSPLQPAMMSRVERLSVVRSDTSLAELNRNDIAQIDRVDIEL